jgi:hypothetical protein
MTAKRGTESGPEGPTFLRLDEVRALALRNLGFASSDRKREARPYADISPLSFRAECLRASLWACSSAGHSPVYVTRWLGAVEPLLTPDPEYAKNKRSVPAVSPDPKEVIRTALEELELVGDVARLPGGYWLPAPLRCVPLHAVKRWLLVGGRPVHSLPAELASGLEYSGAARFATSECVGLPTESEEAWCRFPKEPLEEWTKKIIGGMGLKELDDPDLKLEFYGAGIAKVPGGLNAFQLHRWTPLAASLPDGRYLVRQKMFRGMIHFAIAEVKKGKAVATGPLDPDEVSVRRLMYGVDRLRGCPVKVGLVREKESSRFVLRNEVPRPEHRLLTALARLELRADGRYYPRTWACASRYAAQIEKCMARLGVGLEETREG